ncbi:NADPH-dependent glutamate synthase [Desulfobacca acetoxidans]|uniref:Glutamate synthase (NADPH), homotetrameric n=1 Tax=Desulfobacca acetoxidans (strain ATCC 700848 / DSM 11109 / ASRB2) TaxID=880072 RepID=F2NBX1_DESAR|nr:NADPH-dependent glutamate synthase [Desulfobacca acetoxidans]AEB08048.1 glutamate synthase (NADPH), homotetrameric [Desulfobacca acetoxidans DSM 11109]
MAEETKAPEAPKKEKIPRQQMPEQPADVRRHNFDEVPLGYTPEQAMKEASRCIQCKDPRCRQGCPVEVDIPAFIKCIKEGDFEGAIRKLWEKNALPAVCGRVCPQEVQCEGLCVLGKKDQPVAIGNLEKFAADYQRNHGRDVLPPKAAPTGKKVAVVGSGPSGLTVAGDLILKGHDVTIFEALHAPGGVLIYGIPEFRLPKAIVASECRYLERLGVNFEVNAVIGRSETVDELLERFDVVFLGVGAGLPMFLKVPGEHYIGVYSSNEYLTRSNLMKAYDFPNYDTPLVRGKRVATFGGGNVAMDSARTALRMGAEKSYIIYRRGREELPARKEEIHHAEQEGVEFMLLSAPVRFTGTDDGFLTGVECRRMELGEPDASGRRRPIEIKGSEFMVEIDTAVISIGSSANPLLTKSTPGLALNKWGNIVADPKTGKTMKPRVWAGGDIVTGAATVILAAGAGRVASNSIHDFLTFGW